MEEKQIIPFTMNYYALKTFGRQQYSNPWAALSELIANGYDAGAERVYLYIDMRNKEHAIIEVIDTGSGMNVKDVEGKYVEIGRNRRIEDPDETSTGRKGIGKLAALYLSDVYEIISVKSGQITAWSVDTRGKTDKETPSLVAVNPDEVPICCTTAWDQQRESHGTMIRLSDVNLSRIGDRYIEGLRRRLSDYFLFTSDSRKLLLAIVKTDGDYDSFVSEGIDFFIPVEKQVAFDNMSHILFSATDFLHCTKDTFEVPYKNKRGENKTAQFSREVTYFPNEIEDASSKTRIPLSGKIMINGKEKEYSVKGWIGVHSTIESDPAQKNDSRFVRNSMYTPNRLRIYIRKKLANDTFLSRLNLVGTYANYLEGEISFDILDDNDLDDITTTNRQDFSVDDERVVLLKSITRGLCRQLISLRQKLADRVNEIKENEDGKIIAEQKRRFASETHKDLISAGIPEDRAGELSLVISNKLKGEYAVKTSYKVFISHSSKDRIFTDFIVNYLRHKGAKWDIDPDKTEIFYSSDGTDIRSTEPLADIIKRMLIDSNTDILFFTSHNSMKSQYCLFEGGAAWATRAVEGYSIISLDYSSIPAYLTNGKPEFTFNTKNRDSFNLNEQNYTNLVIILNRLLAQLNNNRSGNEMSLIPQPYFDDKVQMKSKGTSVTDYMDKDIIDYWQTYVIDKIDCYLQ